MNFLPMGFIYPSLCLFGDRIQDRKSYVNLEDSKTLEACPEICFISPLARKASLLLAQKQSSLYSPEAQLTNPDYFHSI